MDKTLLRNRALTAIGILAVGLGVLGIFVPVLPTTPFVLLAAGCFMRSSPRLYHWLIHHRWFGAHIRHYREYHAVTLRVKVSALVMLWGVIGITVCWVVTQLWARALLGVVAVGVTIHLLYLRTLTPALLQAQAGLVNSCQAD